MATVFISHSSRDQDVTRLLREQLHKVGFNALFVDFDPGSGIPAGRAWESELYTRLRRSDAVVFLASEASANSRWCFAEISLARSLGRPVFPVRIEPGAQLSLLDDVQWVDLYAGQFESGFARLVSGLRAAGLDPADSFAWDPTRLPYPGLVAFTLEDAAVFFGREQETRRLVELLHPTLQFGAGRFLAIVGPSGSGKSSLLHAGLLPRLMRPAGRWAVLPSLAPGRYPTRNLARSLARAFAAHGISRPVSDLVESFERGPAALVELTEELAEVSSDNGHSTDTIVVIDQAEELMTRSGAVEQRAFLALLRGALDATDSLWAVATVRSEFLTSRPERAGLAEALDDTLVIEPLGRARLAEVIAGPAHRAGLELAPGLVERMVEDTAGGDALPLLAYTLRELYQQAQPHGRISIDNYAAMGGVVGALKYRADRLARDLARLGRGQRIEATLAQFATVTREDEPTRRRVRYSQLDPEARLVVDAFIEARLLISTSIAVAPDGSGITPSLSPSNETIVEVAHEALLRQWPPLRQAIEADRTGLRLRSDLERLAADWQQVHRDESYLLSRARLAVIDEWAQKSPDKIGSLERDFLAASRESAAQELARLNEEQESAAARSSLERGLMPSPLVGGAVAFSSRYRAGRSRTMIGGAFYDALRDSAGTWHAMIGEISGNGPDEAALGAQLRVAWRAFISANIEEHLILPNLRRILLIERHDESLSATVCTAAISEVGDGGPQTALVRLAAHPPPILLTNKPRAVTPPIGPPLGIDLAGPWDAESVPLDPDWALLLYNSGLIRGRSGGSSEKLGTEGLIDLLIADEDGDTDKRVDRLIDHAERLNGSPLVDDVATLLLLARPNSRISEYRS